MTMLVTAEIGCLLIPFLATHTRFAVATVQYCCDCCCEPARTGFLRQTGNPVMYDFNGKPGVTAGLVLS